MEVLNRVEEAFGMRFSEDSLYDMVTCRDVIEYIEANVSGGRRRQPSASPPSAARARNAPTIEEIPVAHCDVTQFPECTAFEQRLASTAAADLENPFFRVKERVGKGTVSIAGREMISYTSFDYLGMAGNPRVVAAAKQAIDQLGTSASASRLVGGNHVLVQDLDEELARFLGTEAAVVSPSGYGTNALVLGHLFGAEDSDRVRRIGPQQHCAGNAVVQSAATPVPAQRFQVPRQAARRHPPGLSSRRSGPGRRLQHGWRLPELAAVHRSQAAAQSAAVR